MPAVADGDDARVVDVLVENRDVSRRLQDHHVVVVRPRPHRGAGVRAHQATVAEAAVGVVIGEPVAQVQAPDAVGLGELRGVGDAPARRVDDQGRPLVARQLDAAFVPELVVRQHPALGPRLVAGARRAGLGVEEVAVEPRPLRRLEGRRRLGVERRLVGERLGALQRGEGAEREHARDVGVLVGQGGGLRALRGLGRRRRRREQEREKRERSRQASCRHGDLRWLGGFFAQGRRGTGRRRHVRVRSSGADPIVGWRAVQRSGTGSVCRGCVRRIRWAIMPMGRASPDGDAGRRTLTKSPRGIEGAALAGAALGTGCTRPRRRPARCIAARLRRSTLLRGCRQGRRLEGAVPRGGFTQ